MYIALTIPIPFTSSEQLKIPSLFFFILGLYLIVDITSDYVEIVKRKFLIKQVLFLVLEKNWEIFWEDIKSINSPTSQGSKVFYFIDEKGNRILVPQRIENFDTFLEKIDKKTNISANISYISPLDP